MGAMQKWQKFILRTDVSLRKPTNWNVTAAESGVVCWRVNLSMPATPSHIRLRGCGSSYCQTSTYQKLWKKNVVTTTAILNAWKKKSQQRGLKEHSQTLWERKRGKRVGEDKWGESIWTLLYLTWIRIAQVGFFWWLCHLFSLFQSLSNVKLCI